MNQIYYDIFFLIPEFTEDLPADFLIITAYATTGETWSDYENLQADTRIKSHLDSRFSYVKRITGYSPDTGLSESGWMVNCGWEQGCDIGLTFKQDAIYYVSSDKLSVSYCDDRRTKIEVGAFLERVNVNEKI